MKQFSSLLLALLSVISMAVINWSCKKAITPENEHRYSKEHFNHEGLERVGLSNNSRVLQWNENVIKVISKSTSSPPVQSRHFTMTQIAVHDALNSIRPRYQTYALNNFHVLNANPDAAVASATYWTLKLLSNYLVSISFSPLPLQTSGNDLDGWYNTSLAEIPDGEPKTAGIELGKRAAEAILENRSTDNFPTAGISAVPIPVGDLNPPAGRYRPTITNPPYPSNIKGLANWATQMKPFSIRSNDEFRPAAPPSLNSSRYLADYNEVKTLGDKNSLVRTADQSQIANFWQETAVNIWNRLCGKIISDRRMNAWETARAFAILNVAMFDGFLSSFDGLYHYYTWRPESAIRLADNDGNPSTDANTSWLPFVIDIKGPPPALAPLALTPPIPDYPNPNAVVGAAAGRTMQLLFLSDYVNVDLTSMDVLSTGITRNFRNISDAITESFNSRIYAGFNFRYSMEAGDRMGKRIALSVFANDFGYKWGR